MEKIATTLDEYSLEEGIDVIGNALIKLYNVMMNSGDSNLQRHAQEVLDIVFKYTFGEDKGRDKK